MKIQRLWFIFSALALSASLSLAATTPGKTSQAAKLMSQKTLNANAWEIYTTNYGPFVNPQTGSGGFWPAGSGHSYIYGAGLWVGARVSSGDSVVAVGYNLNSGAHEFGPVSLLDNSYQNYLSDPKARVYLSTDPTDFSEWPVLDEESNKVVQSIQDAYSKYSDENPLFTFSGEKILHVLVDQYSYTFNTSPLNDIIYFHFHIKNISASNLNNVFIGPAIDADIGDESGSNANDRTIFDYQRSLAIQFQTVTEPGWSSTGVVGFRFLEGPVNNTGTTVHVTDNQFSHDILPDSALGLTAFKIFTIAQDPSTDEERYLEMSGINHWDLVMDAYDEWGANTPGDKRFVMSSGPFNLGANETVKVCIAVMAAYDTVTLKALSDTAQKYYDENALGIFSNNDEPNTTLHLLSPNAPNPFGRSGTNISYQIGGTGSTPVSLKIYNITGQLVKTLVNDNNAPGRYNAIWNGQSDSGQKVSAGIYIYRLRAGDKSLTKKMVLIK